MTKTTCRDCLLGREDYGVKYCPVHYTEENEYEDDTQIKHHIWWIAKTVGKLPNTYDEFLKLPISEDIARDIDSLVSYIKLNY